MARFLAIYHGAADAQSAPRLSDQQQSDFLDAWGRWAQEHGPSLVDPGAPLFRKKRLTTQGVEEFVDTKVGYAVVEADSHHDAVRMFSEHPHLILLEGNSIEVLECPPVPTP